jgi:membrane-associated protease RseP (regulator of RpoE activity)
MHRSKIHIIKSCSLLSLLSIFIVAGCASPTTKQIKIEDAAAEVEAQKQRKIAFEMWVEDKQRLNNVSYGILTDSVPLCADSTSFSTGIVVANKYSFPAEIREAARAILDVSEALKIIQVKKGSAAEKAGIEAGDLLIGINNWTVPSGEQAAGVFMEKLREVRGEGKPISLKISRDGGEEVIEIVTDKICDYKVLLSNDDIIIAFADGRNVIITRGLMRFTRDDTQLALVVSHELAHNVMKHIDAKKKNYLLGTILDIAAAVYGVDTRGMFGQIGAQAYSKEFEAEADYVGLYMMALAGLDIEEAPKFWRRMATIHPGNIETNHAATHPATPYRFLALEKTVKEINRKISEGLPLMPDMKDDEPYLHQGYDPYDY